MLHLNNAVIREILGQLVYLAQLEGMHTYQNIYYILNFRTILCDCLRSISHMPPVQSLILSAQICRSSPNYLHNIQNICSPGNSNTANLSRFIGCWHSLFSLVTF